jgi:hypothetical protein
VEADPRIVEIEKPAEPPSFMFLLHEQVTVMDITTYNRRDEVRRIEWCSKRQILRWQMTCITRSQRFTSGRIAS